MVRVLPERRRKKTTPHRRILNSQDAVEAPIIKCDYMYMTSAGQQCLEEESFETTFTACDENSGTPIAISIPSKAADAPTDEDLVKCIMQMFDRLWHHKYNLRGDG